MTKAQILEAVKLRKQGIPLSEIAKAIKSNYNATNMLFCRLRKDGVDVGPSRRSSDYADALDVLKSK